AIDLATGERTGGPVFLAADGRRLDRHGAGRIVRKTACRARIGKSVTRHTPRHALIIAALDARVPLRDVQEAASHADAGTTIRLTGPAAAWTGTRPKPEREPPFGVAASSARTSSGAHQSGCSVAPVCVNTYCRTHV